MDSNVAATYLVFLENLARFRPTEGNASYLVWPDFLKENYPSVGPIDAFAVISRARTTPGTIVDAFTRSPSMEHFAWTLNDLRHLPNLFTMEGMGQAWATIPNGITGHVLGSVRTIASCFQSEGRMLLPSDSQFVELQEMLDELEAIVLEAELSGDLSDLLVSKITNLRTVLTEARIFGQSDLRGMVIQVAAELALEQATRHPELEHVPAGRSMWAFIGRAADLLALVGVFTMAIGPAQEQPALPSPPVVIEVRNDVQIDIHDDGIVDAVVVNETDD